MSCFRILYWFVSGCLQVCFRLVYRFVLSFRLKVHFMFLLVDVFVDVVFCWWLFFFSLLWLLVLLLFFVVVGDSFWLCVCLVAILLLKVFIFPIFLVILFFLFCCCFKFGYQSNRAKNEPELSQNVTKQRSTTIKTSKKKYKIL